MPLLIHLLICLLIHLLLIHLLIPLLVRLLIYLLIRLLIYLLIRLLIRLLIPLLPSQVLSPRYEFEVGEKAEKKRKKRLAEEPNIRHPIFQGLSSVQLSDPQEIVNAFKQAEQAELVSQQVRWRNLRSSL